MNRTEIRERRLKTAASANKRWTNTEKAPVLQESKRQTEAKRKSEFIIREGIRFSASVLRERFSKLTHERQIGPTLDFIHYAPDEEAREAGTPVARIVEYQGEEIELFGFGTGFLVTPNLLITNNHVLASAGECDGICAQFNYEHASQGIKKGNLFEIDAKRFFYTNKDLDFTIVAINTREVDGARKLSAQGFNPLIRATGKILENHPINIIQHPDGGPKQYAVTQNKLIKILDNGFLHYSTDTLAGSSGSPAFNKDWEVVGLHHSGVPMMVDGNFIAKDGQKWNPDTMPESEILWIANEGIRVSSIVADFEANSKHLDQTLRQELLSLTSDPLVSESVVSNIPRITDAHSTIIPVPTMAQTSITINGSASFTINNSASESEHQANRALTAQEIAKTTVLTSGIPATGGLLEKKQRFDNNYRLRKGYNSKFLSDEIPLPQVSPTRASEMLENPSGKVMILKYHHFSLAINKARCMQMWSALNVDYSPSMRGSKSRAEYGGEDWKLDPRVDAELQIENEEFYGPATKVDRGHIVRRDDNCWGKTEREREYANADTYHWTNCTPQHQSFNQASKQGLWGQLEVLIADQIGAVNNRVTLFAGPILNESDPEVDYGYGPIQYPLDFWKVVAAVDSDGVLRSYGFVLSQKEPVDRFGLESTEMDFSEFSESQRSIEEIGALCGIDFPQVLMDADTHAGQPAAILTNESKFKARPGVIA